MKNWLRNIFCMIYRGKQTKADVMTKTQVPDRYWRPIVQDWNEWVRERKPYPIPPPDPKYMERMRW